MESIHCHPTELQPVDVYQQRTTSGEQPAERYQGKPASRGHSMEGNGCRWNSNRQESYYRKRPVEGEEVTSREQLVDYFQWRETNMVYSGMTLRHIPKYYPVIG